MMLRIPKSVIDNIGRQLTKRFGESKAEELQAQFIEQAMLEALLAVKIDEEQKSKLSKLFEMLKTTTESKLEVIVEFLVNNPENNSAYEAYFQKDFPIFAQEYIQQLTGIN